MATFLMVGISHQVADLAQLELASGRAAAREALQAAALRAGCAEVLVLSTCSRTELHVVLESGGQRAPAPETPDQRVRLTARRLSALLVEPSPGQNVEQLVQVRIGDDAVFHLCRVAAGLDSRVVGEVEIQAQLRLSARAAAATNGEPHRLRGLVAAALAGAQAAGSAGDVDGRRGLLARRAVQQGLAHVSPRENRDAIVVGAGTMGRQVMESLAAHGCSSALLSRTSTAGPGRGPRVHPLEELPSRLGSADMVFVATSAGRRILHAGVVEQAMHNRQGRALVIVDLAVPRNVDPGVTTVQGVTLLDLDDLADARGRVHAPGLVDAPGRVDAPGGGEVGADIAAVELAAQAAAESYLANLRSREAGPLIIALRDRLEEQCLAQLRRTAAGQPLPDDVLTRMASAVAGTVAHAPTLLLREAAASGDADLLDRIARAFQLQDADSSEGDGETFRLRDAT